MLVSEKKWSGKTVPDHRGDREEFVRQLIARIDKSDRDRENVPIYRVDPGDRSAAPRDELIMRTLAQRIAPESRIRQGASSCWTTRCTTDFGNRTGRAPSGQGRILKPCCTSTIRRRPRPDPPQGAALIQVSNRVYAHGPKASAPRSVLRRMMLESRQDPMTAQTRRRPVWNQPHDVTYVARPVALVLR